jgi:hypothetical protein
MHCRDEKCIQTLVSKPHHMEDHSVDGNWVQKNDFFSFFDATAKKKNRFLKLTFFLISTHVCVMILFSYNVTLCLSKHLQLFLYISYLCGMTLKFWNNSE